MEIEKWLSNVQYDKYGAHIWNVEQNESMQLIADVRGWGFLQYEFKTYEEAECACLEKLIEIVESKLE